jgi:tRNA pseudouridine13 synthase
MAEMRPSFSGHAPALVDGSVIVDVRPRFPGNRPAPDVAASSDGDARLRCDGIFSAGPAPGDLRRQRGACSTRARNAISRQTRRSRIVAPDPGARSHLESDHIHAYEICLSEFRRVVTGAADELPYAHGGPALRGVLRVAPEDFFVDEDLGFEPDGTGEHAFVRIEKRNANTEWVARELAQFAAVAPQAVGYAGMKDRRALTRQTFSVHLPGRPDPDWSALQNAEYRVIDASRNSRKLKTGALRGNAFRIVLRDVTGSREQFEEQIAAVAQRGVPNYFGEQRFGRRGDNVENARRMFHGVRVQRHERGLLLSAARSFLFNEVLAERVRQGTWNAALAGDVWMLAGSQSIFGPEPMTTDLAARLSTGDIGPTGPMFGAGTLRTRDEALRIEQAVADMHADLLRGLIANELRQERRALVLRPTGLSSTWLSERDLEIAFDLRKGSYATVILREICMSDITDERPG